MVDYKSGFKRVEALYSGRVQGVGFRFTAQGLAEDMDIKGWVKNLSDGTVQLLIEGSEDNINKFLSQLKTRFKDAIQNVQVCWQEPSGKFNEFIIVI